MSFARMYFIINSCGLSNNVVECRVCVYTCASGVEQVKNLKVRKCMRMNVYISWFNREKKEQEERMYIHQFMFEMGAKRVETAHMGVVSSLELLPPPLIVMMMIITPLGKRRTFQLLPLPLPPHHYNILYDSAAPR